MSCSISLRSASRPQTSSSAVNATVKFDGDLKHVGCSDNPASAMPHPQPFPRGGREPASAMLHPPAAQGRNSTRGIVRCLEDLLQHCIDIAEDVVVTKAKYADSHVLQYLAPFRVTSTDFELGVNATVEFDGD